MRLAVLLLFVACAASSQEVSNGQDKPGYGQTEAPDKQVEYVTGPNVGIVGPTVLGGKGQEVQPSGEDLQSTDKEQRDVSAQYSGYQGIPEQQEDAKGQLGDSAYPKYTASNGYSEGMKYIHSQVEAHNQYTRKGPHKKPPVVKIGNVHRPTAQKVTYYQSEGPARYPQSAQPEQNYYEPQNQEQNSAQLQAHIRAHQISQSSIGRPQEYQQIAAQNHGQEEKAVSQSQTEKSGASASSQEAHSHGSSEESEGQQAPPTAPVPVYIPQEYLQYQIAAAQEDLQSSLQFPSKHHLQLFLPQEGISGHVNIQAEQPQGTPHTVQGSQHLHPIQNGHQIQYIPAYYASQSPSTLQKERQSNHPPAPQNPSAQIIRQSHHPAKYSQPPINLQNTHSSSPTNPSSYHRPQPHPQLHSNFQPSQHQPTSPFSNDPAHYHLLQQSNEAIRRPQALYVQSKQNTQPIQFTQKPTTTKASNHYIQAQSQPTVYRPKSPERLPQRQPENLALVSQSPPKTTQHRQTHDRPPHALQPEQHYQSESIQSTDDKLGQPLQGHTYTIQNIQKIQTPLHIQSPTPFPVKVAPVQPQIHVPLTHTYELPSEKGTALRPIIYPVGTPFEQSVQAEIPHQSLGLIPTEAAKLYNVKLPSYIKALEQAGQSKPFGFSQMSYGQTPGSYSYSIFNKHS